jgi:hypothetical protein
MWFCIGILLLLGVLPPCWVMVTEHNDAADPQAAAPSPIAADDLTLGGALATPAFWAVALTCSLFHLVSSGTFMFFEDILGTFGYSRGEYINMMSALFLMGIGFNLLCGWLARKWTLTRLLGVASLALAGTLVTLPFARTMAQLYQYAAATAFVGGAVTVVFFAVWRPLFGATHLGFIQGAAQLLTVVASAAGQWLFPAAKEWGNGSYVPLLTALAIVAGLLGVWVWFVGPPRRYTVRSGSANLSV